MVKHSKTNILIHHILKQKASIAKHRGGYCLVGEML